LANEIVLEVEGLEELRKALEQFPNEWDRYAKMAMKQGLIVLESTAKAKAPWDTGALSGSIGSEIVGGPGSEIVGKVGTNIVYGPIQEYGGTIDRVSTRGKEYQIVIPAQPYLRPTLKEKGTQVIGFIEQGIERVLKALGLKT